MLIVVVLVVFIALTALDANFGDVWPPPSARPRTTSTSAWPPVPARQPQGRGGHELQHGRGDLVGDHGGGRSCWSRIAEPRRAGGRRFDASVGRFDTVSRAFRHGESRFGTVTTCGSAALHVLAAHDPAYRDIPLRPLGAGLDHAAFAIGDLVVRVATGPGSDFVREAELLRLLAARLPSRCRSRGSSIRRRGSSRTACCRVARCSGGGRRPARRSSWDTSCAPSTPCRSPRSTESCRLIVPTRRAGWTS